MSVSLGKRPECRGKVSGKAVMCPHCGRVLSAWPFGYEYRSRTELFGLPLVHVVLGFGINPMTGRPRVAKGIIAIGHTAFGLVAVGGIAFGGISVGGLALGLAAVGGCAVGLGVAIGGAAVGIVAVGGGALGYYAIGAGP